MTSAPHPHEVLLKQIREEFAEILGQTSQGVYIYQDDPHWICNERLASMLGYSSASEFLKAATSSPFLDVAVAAESTERVVSAYMNSVENKVASIAPVTWKKKGGGTINTQVIFVPISYMGNPLTIHFVTPI